MYAVLGGREGEREEEPHVRLILHMVSVKSEFYHIQVLCKSTASPILMLPCTAFHQLFSTVQIFSRDHFHANWRIDSDWQSEAVLPACMHSCCTYLDAITSDVFKILKWFWGVTGRLQGVLRNQSTPLPPCHIHFFPQIHYPT